MISSLVTREQIAEARKAEADAVAERRLRHLPFPDSVAGELLQRLYDQTAPGGLLLLVRREDAERAIDATLVAGASRGNEGVRYIEAARQLLGLEPKEG